MIQHEKSGSRRFGGRLMRGLGTDIVAIARIKKLIDSHGNHFLDKVFTPEEIDYCSGKAHPSIHFSGRWAVKEAFYKALPDALQPAASWKCIEILPEQKHGRPVIRIVDRIFAEKCTEEGLVRFHCSISHEQTHCVAVVVLE